MTTTATTTPIATPTTTSTSTYFSQALLWRMFIVFKL